MCCQGEKEKMKDSSFVKTILATLLGGLLAASGSLFLYSFQFQDNNKKEIIDLLLKSYEKQKSCMSQIRPIVSKMFEQGVFVDDRQSFANVFSYSQNCKNVGHEFYLQLIRLKVIKKKDYSTIKNCVLLSFNKYRDLKYNDLKQGRIDLIGIDKQYIQPQVECSIETFNKIDSRIESALDESFLGF